MTLSQRIAEAKGWYFERSDRGLYVDKETLPITDYSNGQKTCDKALTLYSPETNKAQAMDLLIEGELSIGPVWTGNPIRTEWMVISTKEAIQTTGKEIFCIDKDPLIAICKAWLAAFGGEDEKDRC